MSQPTTWMKDKASNSMPQYLKPHTSQWFEALMLNNAPQAIQTAAIVRAAGSEDICSICGDVPAKDYRLITGNPLPPGTLRLCNDCVLIRRDMCDEDFVPLVDYQSPVNSF